MQKGGFSFGNASRSRPPEADFQDFPGFQGLRANHLRILPPPAARRPESQENQPILGAVKTAIKRVRKRAFGIGALRGEARSLVGFWGRKKGGEKKRRVPPSVFPWGAKSRWQFSQKMTFFAWKNSRRFRPKPEAASRSGKIPPGGGFF